jgi:hypothetical protein
MRSRSNRVGSANSRDAWAMRAKSVLRLASRVDRIERAHVTLQAREPLGIGCGALVGNVVGAAREAVDGLDRASHGRGKQPRGHGKFS